MRSTHCVFTSSFSKSLDWLVCPNYVCPQQHCWVHHKAPNSQHCSFLIRVSLWNAQCGSNYQNHCVSSSQHCWHNPTYKLLHREHFWETNKKKLKSLINFKKRGNALRVFEWNLIRCLGTSIIDLDTKICWEIILPIYKTRHPEQ